MTTRITIRTTIRTTTSITVRPLRRFQEAGKGRHIVPFLLPQMSYTPAHP